MATSGRKPRKSRGAIEQPPSVSEIGAQYGIRQDDMHRLPVSRPREVVCMERRISKWDDEADRAEGVIGKENTSDLGKTKIFITVRRDFLYAHSNFVKRDCHYPSKLITNQPRKLDDIASNLVGTEDDFASPYFYHEFWRAMVEDFIFYVDEAVLSDERYSFLEFSGLANVYVINEGNEILPLQKWGDLRSKDLSSSRNSIWLAIEFAAVLAAAVIGVLWLRDEPEKPYEPITFLCLLLGITAVDIARRHVSGRLERTSNSATKQEQLRE